MLIVFIFFISCNSIDCGELTFDKKNKITFLNKIPYTGSCNSFFISGDLKSNESYLNGKDDGKWIYYFINGNKQVEGEFSLGKKINKWTYYYENGTTIRPENFNTTPLKIFSGENLSGSEASIGLYQVYNETSIPNQMH